MSPKMWLHRSQGRAALSAKGFLDQHRQYLETGELAEVASPILRLLDDKKLMPTPALEQIQQAVVTHLIRKNVEEAEKSLINARANGSNTNKHWVASIYNSKGTLQTRISESGKVIFLEERFELASDADRWTDRMLFDAASDCFATISHDTLNCSTTVMRSDSIARVLAKGKQPFSKRVGGRDSKLSFGVKAVQSRASFSRG